MSQTGRKRKPHTDPNNLAAKAAVIMVENSSIVTPSSGFTGLLRFLVADQGTVY